MKLGIKVNIDADSYERMRITNPKLVEVWFNANNTDTYNDLFAELTRRKCDVGLHFWGLCDDNIAPNIAYPDQHILKQSMDLIRGTIDTAASHGFQYVNIHPGASALAKVNYKTQRYDLMTEPIDTELSIKLFLEHAQELSDYAKAKNIVFTVETVPLKITDGWYEAESRNHPKDLHELPIRAVELAASHGLMVANDFCHTASSMTADNPHEVFIFVKNTTVKLADQTKLIHMGFVIPPYNGTDHHGTFDNPLLDTDHAVPNNNQFVELLKIFGNRDDIWILAEPSENHAKNYFLIEKLIDLSRQN